MGRVKRIAGLAGFVVLISVCSSVGVYSWMRGDALEKMLAIEEAMVIQNLAIGTSAVRNLTRARFDETEQDLYSSLGINMTFLKRIYDSRGRLPDNTIALLVRNVSQYQKSSEVSRNKRFEHVFNKDILDFMSRVEKAERE